MILFSILIDFDFDKHNINRIVPHFVVFSHRDLKPENILLDDRGMFQNLFSYCSIQARVG